MKRLITSIRSVWALFRDARAQDRHFERAMREMDERYPTPPR
jgi:hypothetical protein